MPYSDTGKEFRIAQQLKKYRKKANMTQQHLAFVAGISLQTLAKIESGTNTNPKISTLASIAHELDVSVDSLLGLKMEQ